MSRTFADATRERDESGDAGVVQRITNQNLESGSFRMRILKEEHP
jgi:hypothetical protein